METTRLDWDMAFLGEHLIDQIAAWCDDWWATHPPADEHPASPPTVGPAPPSAEPLEIPPPLPKVHHEQVIENDLVLAVRVDESDGSVEQINNPDVVLDRQEEWGLVHFLFLDSAVCLAKARNGCWIWGKCQGHRRWLLGEVNRYQGEIVGHLSCYILDFCDTVVIWKATIEPSIYVWLTLIRGYNCENCYALKVHEVEISWIFRKIIT